LWVTVWVGGGIFFSFLRLWTTAGRGKKDDGGGWLFFSFHQQKIIYSRKI
jgi:hypothetical protein